MELNRRFVLGGLIAGASGLALPAFAGGHGRIGKFKGVNNHKVTGRVELIKEAKSGVISLLDDFRFDGAPDPKMALGKGGKYDSSTLSGLLKKYKGASSFTLPAGINPDDYDEVWVWCEKFSVGLGVARLG